MLMGYFLAGWLVAFGLPVLAWVVLRDALGLQHRDEAGTSPS